MIIRDWIKKSNLGLVNSGIEDASLQLKFVGDFHFLLTPLPLNQVPDWTQSPITFASCRLLAGATDGRILYIEDGQLKAVHNALTLMVFDPNPFMDQPQDVQPLRDVQDVRITCCTRFKTGFMFVVGGTRVFHYEMKTDLKYV